MITIKEFMELVEYRITEGSEYGWQCFGSNAYSLSSWNGDHDGWSFNIVFDTRTQVVYVAEVCDYLRQRAYRIINPDFKKAHDDEARSHDVNPREAWDEVNYVDLEEDDDFIQKGQAIRDGVEYDTRVNVPVNLPDDVLLILMKKAHEQDITFNQLMENILKEEIDRVRNQNPDLDWDEWDEICEDHWDDDGDEMLSDLQDMKPAASMKAKKKKKK